jgi:tetratricopeptide (TPR) repeat protein
MVRLFSFLAAGTALAGFAGPVQAENIVRRNEKPLSGEVTAVTRTAVSVKIKTPKEETIEVPANEIVNIIWTGEAPDWNVARSDENRGNYQKALDGYQKALAANKVSNPVAKIDLEYAMARTEARQALADPALVDQAIKRLDDFRSKQSDHYRYFEALGFLGQLYAAKKEFIKAQTTFEAMGKAPWKDFQMASRNALARLAQAENRLDEAAGAFDAVIAMTPQGPLEESQRQEAMIGKVRVLLAQRSFDKALLLLDEVIAKSAAEDARVQAEAYVRQGDCYRELGKDNDALIAYLHVDVLFPGEKALQAESLFHLVRLWEKTGQKGRAAETRDRLLSDDFRNTEWARQLKAPAAE